MTTVTKSKNRNKPENTSLTKSRPARDRLAEEFLRFLEVERNASPRTLRIYRDALRNFREEILESLKHGVPPQMKDQIERYFKNLSE